MNRAYGCKGLKLKGAGGRNRTADTGIFSPLIITFLRRRFPGRRTGKRMRVWLADKKPAGWPLDPVPSAQGLPPVHRRPRQAQGIRAHIGGSSHAGSLGAHQKGSRRGLHLAGRNTRLPGLEASVVGAQRRDSFSRLEETVNKLLEILKDSLESMAGFFLVMAVASALVWFVVFQITETPLVYRSWSTKECVRVEPASAGDCDNLPDRYRTIWVK